MNNEKQWIHKRYKHSEKEKKYLLSITLVLLFQHYQTFKK